MNIKTLKAACFAIYVFYEILVVVADVGLLTLLFLIPTSVGFFLKKYLGEIFSEACLVLGIVLLSVTYVHRKTFQRKFQIFFRSRSEKKIKLVCKKYGPGGA